MVLSRLNQLPPSLLAATFRRRLEQGAFLYRRGDAASSVFIVERGRLCLYSTTNEGTAVPLYTAYVGECVSEAAIFADFYCGDVRAEVASCVRVFPKLPLLAAIREDAELAEQFMAAQAKRFHSLRMRLELRSLRSAQERVLQYFRAIATSCGETFLIDRPLKSVADDLGLSHESFYRTIAQLVKEGSIRREKRFIHVANWDKSVHAQNGAERRLAVSPL